jgi:hypothetical protein
VWYNGRMNNEVGDNAVLEFFKGIAGPFRTYPNPMRSDGVFIGQDKPILPYKGIRGWNGPLYPAVPQDAIVFPCQLSRDAADTVIARLNNKLTEPR